MVLRNILITNQTALSQTATTKQQEQHLQEKQQPIDVMKHPLTVISSIPVLVMYPLVQKHFVKGKQDRSMKVDLQEEVFLTIYPPHGKRRHVNKESGQRTGKALRRENAAGTIQREKIMKRKAQSQQF
ncbi:hypothetical protein [Clostridium sp.]|uniref:hypothetical protein n=1 Tax=Clostridium sp. TaxID=1506 RepID=UPI002583C772|nr:hypothetical protein [Clostridium sp.]